MFIEIVVILLVMMTIGERNANVKEMNRKKIVRLVNEVISSRFDFFFLIRIRLQKPILTVFHSSKPYKTMNFISKIIKFHQNFI